MQQAVRSTLATMIKLAVAYAMRGKLLCVAGNPHANNGARKEDRRRASGWEANGKYGITHSLQ